MLIPVSIALLSAATVAVNLSPALALPIVVPPGSGVRTFGADAEHEKEHKHDKDDDKDDKDDHDDEDGTEVEIEFKDLPKAVQDSFQKEFAGAKMVEVVKETYPDGSVNFGIEFIDKAGKKHEAEYDADGKKLEEE